jgi:hypothetical protein
LQSCTKGHIQAQVRPVSGGANLTNIDWPTASTFTVEVGRQKIAEFIDRVRL